MLDPENLGAQRILEEPNAEVRRVMLERFGCDRFVKDLGLKAKQQDEFGTLYRMAIRDDEPLVMVEVVNSTPERDGSLKKYMLRVPPNVTTARAGIAWTFGMTEGEYGPSLAS